MASRSRRVDKRGGGQRQSESKENWLAHLLEEDPVSHIITLGIREELDRRPLPIVRVARILHAWHQIWKHAMDLLLRPTPPRTPLLPSGVPMITSRAEQRVSTHLLEKHIIHYPPARIPLALPQRVVRGEGRRELGRLRLRRLDWAAGGEAAVEDAAGVLADAGRLAPVRLHRRGGEARFGIEVPERRGRGDDEPGGAREEGVGDGVVGRDYGRLAEREEEKGDEEGGHDRRRALWIAYG